MYSSRLTLRGGRERIGSETAGNGNEGRTELEWDSVSCIAVSSMKTSSITMEGLLSEGRSITTCVASPLTKQTISPTIVASAMSTISVHWLSGAGGEGRERGRGPQLFTATETLVVSCCELHV